MALGTAIVGSGGETNGAAVLHVAGIASRNERLTLIVGWSFVTSEACAIHDWGAKTGSAEVAQTAAIAENGVGRGHRPTAVDALTAEQIGVKNPGEGQQGRPDRKPQFPAAEGVKLGEILQVDTLGYRLGCPHSRHGQYLSAKTAWMAASASRAYEMGICTRSQP